MKNFRSMLKEKLDSINTEALNRLRVISILCLALVFGVTLHRGMFRAAPPVSRHFALAAVAGIAQDKSAEVKADDNPAKQSREEGDSALLVSAPAIIPETASSSSAVLSEKVMPAKVVSPYEALPNLSARAVFVADASLAHILYEKEADTEFPEASLTKLATAVVVREHIKLGDVIEITKHAVDTEGLAGALRVGERFTASDLLKVLLIVSSNDAAVAFEDHLAAQGLDIVALMNEKAKELGMTHTHFTNVSGLDENGHYASAKDLARLISFSLRDSKLWDILSERIDTVQSVNKKIRHALSSTNELLQRHIPGVLGGKTGYTQNALGCMIAVIEGASGKGIIVVLGSEDRFGDTKALVAFAKDVTP